MDKTEKIYFILLAIGELIVTAICGTKLTNALMNDKTEKPKEYIVIVNDTRLMANCYIAAELDELPDNVWYKEK